jgi:hypoxanthine phosphoribosyltransferase
MEKEITVLDKTFVPFLASRDIDQAVTRLAGLLNEDYRTKNPLFLAILNGAFVFAADLFRKISFPCEISFVKLASYKGTKSTGNVLTAIGLDVSLQNRHIVVLEDIVDTGKTLSAFVPQMEAQQPASIAICTLLHKPDAAEVPLQPDYVGLTIPNRFVVGYGLDYDGYGRNLTDIYQLKE